MSLLLQNDYLNCLPESLETARLLIRTAKPGDGAILHAAVAASYDELKPWLAWVEPLPTLEQSEQNCRAFYANFLLNQSLVALFIDKASGELVGGSGFHTVNWQLRQFETGYWRRTGWGGKGLMTEGVNALCAHALLRLGASRVYLTCDEQNSASRTLAERCGFELEGIMRNERLNLQGALRNTCMYARVKAQT